MFGRTFTRAFSTLRGQHILSAKQFNREQIEHLCRTASDLRHVVSVQGCSHLLQGRVLYNMFLEPSTRTMSSFHIAMLRLGGQVFSMPTENSSFQKGETLEDSIQVVSGYSDVIVMRNPQQGTPHRAAQVSRVPIINAGDGNGEHPTQALLDIYCIYRELGQVDGLTVTMMGDLKNGRTVHSLSRLLANFKIKQLIYVSPQSLQMPNDLVDELNRRGIKQAACNNINDAIAQTDVLYVTRLQKERFADVNEYESLKGSYNLDANFLKQAKEKMIIMHPLPRLWEIPTSIDADPRAAYFRQAQDGLYLRMALLAAVLGRV